MAKNNTKKSEQPFNSFEYASTRVMLQRILTSQEYFVQVIRHEIDVLDTNLNPTAADLLKARGYIQAHAGINDGAIADLNALISQKAGLKAHNVNKLAQVLIRRGEQGDFERAIELSRHCVEKLAKNKRELWYAFHNEASALYATGDLDGAAVSAKKALSQRDDFRTQAILDMASSGDSRADVREVLISRGLLSKQLSGSDVGKGDVVLINAVEQMSPSY